MENIVKKLDAEELLEDVYTQVEEIREQDTLENTVITAMVIGDRLARLQRKARKAACNGCISWYERKQIDNFAEQTKEQVSRNFKE